MKNYEKNIHFNKVENKTTNDLNKQITKFS